ncbi:MAG: DEAD/DEAH box helicase family protein, partial [Chloroflexia bacterium]|nr:DEAD/DEAH box helicase family protein [Chloroflexia bacterium]
MLKPEELARQGIDAALVAAGWVVQDYRAMNLYAGCGVAVREFSLTGGHGFADYLLFVDRQAVGAVEAKKQGTTLTGVEIQSAKYGAGLPEGIPAPVRPLPFLYESTGIETRFTSRLDPEPRSRRVFNFHKPETLGRWLKRHQRFEPAGRWAAEEDEPYVVDLSGGSRVALRRGLQTMPPIIETGLWAAQIAAVRNLEQSLRNDHPRSLVQMATGSGKTFTSITSIYRLIKYGGAERVLFLVDRANLGRQTLKEFQNYTTPDDGRKFTELYNVQLLTSNKIDPVARVVITTIQRLFSMLRGDEEFDATLEEGSTFDSLSAPTREPVPVAYNPAIPVETFDVIFTDECHRSIYNLWRQVLEYFDAYLIGLTATPSKQTFAFFNQNLVMEYNHQQAVIDRVNVDYVIYRIRTKITEGGSTVEAGPHVDKRDRLTRAERWELLDEEFSYDPNQLDRAVVSMGQMRAIVREFRDKLFSEIFPGRNQVPKTLIFAKDDSHADDIVKIVREEFGKGNDFCQKITYRTTGRKPEDLLQDFRNSYNPRIVVTVDMIATGTDIKPLEIVMFMRAVKSRNFFEQMKGRGVRVINDTDFNQVTPDASGKTHFVLIDCVGVTEQIMTDSPPLERNPTIAFDKLLNLVTLGNIDEDVLSSLAGRLSRLDHQLGSPDREKLAQTAGGMTIQDIAQGLLDAIDPDRQRATAQQANGLADDVEPAPEQLKAARQRMMRAAVRPLAANPELRNQIIDVKQRFEQTIDTISVDEIIDSGYSAAAREKAEKLVRSFETYIEEHKDEITALQVLYNRPYAQRLRLHDMRALADSIASPPRSWTQDALWHAYETLDRTKVRGSAGTMLTNVVSLVRYATHQTDELVPFPEQAQARFDAWIVEQEGLGRTFTTEQRQWLQDICNHIGGNLRIERDDFDYVPFAQQGGLGKVY